METEAEFDQLIVFQSENLSPTNHRSKLNRLKKDNSMEIDFQTSSGPSIEPDELEREKESDGLDPLFEDAHQYKAKRVLEFDDNGCGLSEDDANADFEYQNNNKEKKKRNGAEFQGNKDKKRRIKTDREKIDKTSKGKGATSNRTKKKERKAHQAQLADFQRVMRERKNVGFKSVPMVEKSISSVLEKIRQRKMELSKKRLVFTEKDQATDDGVVTKDQASDDGVAKKFHASEDGVVLKDQVKKDGVGDKCQIEEDGVVDKDQGNAAPLKWTSEDEQITNNNPLVDDITQSFRAPINDTQDLFLDSMRSDSQGDELNDFSCPVEDIAPSAPLLNLKIDSAFADDISSNDEGSDKENINPHPKHLLRGSSPATDDPVKKFLDEEAEEDDSDNDLLHIQDKDEEDSSDMEENCDYIATDVEEKQIDRLRGNQRHQEWCQQQDEAETEMLLQKLHYGVKQSEPSVSDDDDADTTDKEDVDTTKDKEDEDDEYDRNDRHTSSSHVTTKRLKQMIPQMFTDEDDGFVSSDDEETEIRLSKQYILQKVAVEKQSNFLSTAEDETSREVFGRIKKLNVIPETKKKARTSSVFDALLIKGTDSTSSKSSFLRRASCNPGPSSHRRAPSTGRSFIFGRDDSNSRSSMSLPEESPNLGHKESHQKKSSSAKFVSSQAKWSTQHTEMVRDTAYSNSLFDILRSSSVKTGYDNRENIVDHQTIFAAFRPVKKQLKLQGRSSQGA